LSAAPVISNSSDTPAISFAGGCTLRVCRHIRDLEALRPAWHALLNKYPLSTTFSSWEWLSCWWRAYGGHRTLLAYTLFDSTNTLVGMATFSLGVEKFWGGTRVRVLRLLGDGSYDSDNLDMPAVAGFEDVLARGVIEDLTRRSSQWDLCEFNTLPPDSPVAACLSFTAKSQGWPLVEDLTCSSAIHLPDAWEKYLAALSSEDNKNIQRYTRRLRNRYTARFYRCTQNHELPRCLDALFRLHQGRWQHAGERGTFSSSARRQFYQELSLSLLARGWLELWVLELDGEIAAVQFAFRFRDTVFQLQEGYDHLRSSDRPGYVLRAEVLRTLISEGVRTYDFLGGEDSYKARWRAERCSYRTLRCAMPYTKGAILLRMAENALAGKQWLRRNVPKSAWLLLRKLNASAQRKRLTTEITTSLG
jgi:CelD/BcsL family acetyltransferase involved in cellulose biosynthesis